MNRETEALANKRIEESKKRIAKALNLVQSAAQDIKWACESAEWNDEVVFDIEEAATKLGYSLATLTTWDEEETDG